MSIKYLPKLQYVYIANKDSALITICSIYKRD